MIYYGFYDSIDRDRTYDAAAMNRIFDGIITNGVFAAVGQKFAITPVRQNDPDAANGTYVRVGTGMAWFDSTWTVNDSPLTFEVQQNLGANPRTDFIELIVDKRIGSKYSAYGRRNTIILSAGGPYIPGDDDDSRANVHVHHLATIQVPPGTYGQVVDSWITSYIGTSSPDPAFDCPYVTAAQDIRLDAFTEEVNDAVNTWIRNNIGDAIQGWIEVLFTEFINEQHIDKTHVFGFESQSAYNAFVASNPGAIAVGDMVIIKYQNNDQDLHRFFILEESGNTTVLADKYTIVVGTSSGSSAASLPELGCGYATSGNTAQTVKRTADLTDYALTNGGYVVVKFTTAVSATNPTLNINNTGDKAIYLNGSAIPSGTIKANDIVTLVYDGTRYNVTSIDTAISKALAALPATNFKPAKLGGGLAVTTDLGTTAIITADLTDFVLTIGGTVSVRFMHDVLANSVLNINNTVNVPIYVNGEAIKADTIYYGNIATFIFDGDYFHLIAIDTARANPSYGAANEGYPLVVGPNGDPVVGNWQGSGGGGVPSGGWTENSLSSGVLDLLHMAGGIVLNQETYATATRSIDIAGYRLVAGAMFTVRFMYKLKASAKLQVSADGGVTYTDEKPIYFGNSSLAENQIKAGDTITFRYDGHYYRVIARIPSSPESGSGGFVAEEIPVQVTAGNNGLVASIQYGYQDVITKIASGARFLTETSTSIFEWRTFIKNATTVSMFAIMQETAGYSLYTAYLSEVNGIMTGSITVQNIGNVSRPNKNISVTAASVASGFAISANTIYEIDGAISGFKLINGSNPVAQPGEEIEIRLTVGATAITTPTWPAWTTNKFMGDWDGTTFEANTEYVIIIDDAGKIYHSTREVAAS